MTFCLITAAWTLEHTTDEILEILEKVSVPAGKIYDAKDIVEDKHINARGMIENVTIGTEEEGRGWNLKASFTCLFVELCF
jgi:crotonobetainyl-CoA:carnitine CoA-transferase CaiB-like acyl-CoA transferase